MAITDLYVSLDVEADGPIPCEYSMLSFGLVVAGRYESGEFTPADLSETFYRELQPISEKFDPAALAVSGLDRELLVRTGAAPATAMMEADKWIIEMAQGAHPVLVGFPIVFDWLFFYWYMRRFNDSTALSFSDALDMKTMYQQKAKSTIERAGLDSLPESLRPSSTTHTHNALDDAIEQAEILRRLLTL